MTKIKPKHLVILLVFIALIVTNPSKSTFTEFLESQHYYRTRNERDFYGRKVNLIILSIYTYNEAYRQLIGNTLDYHEHWYVGVFSNFIPITENVKHSGYAYE